jgi:hypothetical protein
MDAGMSKQWPVASAKDSGDFIFSVALNTDHYPNNEIRQWLNENISGNWAIRYHPVHSICFTNDNDAMMFKLWYINDL